MRELKRILVATDLAGGTDSIVATAIFLARAFDSHVLLLHVVPDILPDTWNADVGAESVDVLLSDLKSRVETNGVHVSDVAILTGKASYGICQYAEKKSVDLIVLGASRSFRPDARIGLTASRVLRNSVKPVWVVAPSTATHPRSILCPVDGSPAARRALDNAIRLAKHFDTRLIVVAVREGIPEVYVRMMRPDDSSPSRALEQLRVSTTALVKQYDVTGLQIDIEVRDGSPHAEILSVASENACDLIVMGAEGT
ncbi:MAG: universal stress protein, partial [Gemmatimonadales bacterium]